MDNAQNQFVGVSRGGRSTKIHAVVDGLGNPCVLMLTGGQAHDSVMMKPALDQLDIGYDDFKEAAELMLNRLIGIEKEEKNT